MVATALTIDSTGALSTSQHREVAAGRDRAKKVRRAAAVANFNAWATAIFAALSAPFAPFSLAGAFLTVGMGVVAYNEFRGRRRLLEFDERAASLLGWNQIGFLGVLVGYCLWMMLSGLIGPSPLAAEFEAKPELREVLGSAEEFDQVFKLAVAGFYSIVILLSVVFQGSTALYYFTRRRHVAAYNASTPAWVRQVQSGDA